MHLNLLAQLADCFSNDQFRHNYKWGLMRASLFEIASKAFRTTTSLMHLLIVSGRSGAGKSSALGALEDLDFYCIDNLPVALLKDTVTTVSTLSPDAILAVSIDIRTLGHPADVPALVKVLEEHVTST